MIISIDDIKEIKDFKNIDETILKQKLDAIENYIRQYTNNNFQNRAKRIIARCTGTSVFNKSNFFKVNDTIQISESINNGLYTIKSISKIGKLMTVDKELYEAEHNLITKVEYPQTVIEGAINMLIFDVTKRNKIDVKSETISRHSVTYFDMNNQTLGYPPVILGFLKPYIKARF